MSTNSDRVLAEIRRVWPDWISNSLIGSQTEVKSHQQVFQITRRLTKSGFIIAEKRGGEWFFREHRDQAGVRPSVVQPQDKRMRSDSVPPPGPQPNPANCRIFESRARVAMSAEYQTPLSERALPGVPKRFDFVSADGSVVGDAKYYDLVRGLDTPPAKYSVIAEHVWLLERTCARSKFLVFGNNRLVPERWLRKYGHLVAGVEFWFLDDNGVLERLSRTRLNG